VECFFGIILKTLRLFLISIGLMKHVLLFSSCTILPFVVIPTFLQHFSSHLPLAFPFLFTFTAGLFFVIFAEVS